MTESFTLPLRSLRQKQKPEDDLAIKIAQINAQRGSFRNVTEASLLAEIEAARNVEEDAVGSSAAEALEEDEQSREEKLFKCRAEISQFAMDAHMEATYALEFVSLLLSKYNPRQAEMSMSPLLKQKIPLGALGADRTRPPEQSDAQKRDIAAVSRGWKLESLDSAATKLLQSAERLEKDITAETRYWSDVLKIKEKGWKVCRLPREKQTLGVHFGFLESTPTFRDRGLAALRKADEGSLVLDCGITATPPRIVRVRILDGDQTVGVSIPTSAPRTDDEALDARIREARDSLFEEELFHELNREARLLLRHGVETSRNLIEIPAIDSKKIIIDLIESDDEFADTDTELTPLYNNLAAAVAKALRVLLSHAHRENFRRRTQIPSPLAPAKKLTLEYALIRPILCHFQHRSHYHWFTTFLDNATHTLQSAGLECKYVPYPFKKRTLQGVSRPKHHALETTSPERFLDDFVQPLESIFNCPLSSKGSWFRLRLTTNMDPNGLGSEFEIVTNLSHFSPQPTPLRFGRREDVQELILNLFTLDLVYLIPSLEKHPNTATESEDFNPGAQSLNKEEELWGENGLPHPSPISELNSAHLLPWKPTFPQQGELTAFSPSRSSTGRLQVQFEGDKLQLCFSWAERGRTLLDKESNRKQQGNILFSWLSADAQGAEENAEPVTLKKALQILRGKVEGTIGA
ncbi:RNA polymerase II mediator complex subunit [Ophidiomyces ophidiicola]|nr:RNA polymerase II mediator complex subunit [Ophidiomyces ophidiicola]